MGYRLKLDRKEDNTEKKGQEASIMDTIRDRIPSDLSETLRGYAGRAGEHVPDWLQTPEAKRNIRNALIGAGVGAVGMGLAGRGMPHRPEISPRERRRRLRGRMFTGAALGGVTGAGVGLAGDVFRGDTPFLYGKAQPPRLRDRLTRNLPQQIAGARYVGGGVAGAGVGGTLGTLGAALGNIPMSEREVWDLKKTLMKKVRAGKGIIPEAVRKKQYAAINRGARSAVKGGLSAKAKFGLSQNWEQILRKAGWKGVTAGVAVSLILNILYGRYRSVKG